MRFQRITGTVMPRNMGRRLANRWARLIHQADDLKISIARFALNEDIESRLARCWKGVEHVAVYIGVGLLLLLSLALTTFNIFASITGFSEVAWMMNVYALGWVAYQGHWLYQEEVRERRMVQPWFVLVAFAVVSAICIVVPVLPSLPLVVIGWWFGRRVKYIRTNYQWWHQESAEFPVRYLPYGLARVNKLRYLHQMVAKDKSTSENHYSEKWPLLWGGAPVSYSQAVYNFMMVGSIGSGKTLLLQLFTQRLMHHIGPGGTKRLIIFDQKRENLSQLKGMNPDCQIYILNPFDPRHHAWDLCGDVQSPSDCWKVTCVLVPERPGEKNSFWRDISRQIVYGVLLFFYVHVSEELGRRWTFRDVLWACNSYQRVLMLLKSHPQTIEFANLIEREGELSNSIMVTVKTYLGEYHIIAALWEQAERQGRVIGLQQWINSSSVLMVGHDESNHALLASINRLMFRLLIPVISDMPSKSHPVAETFLLLDEFNRLGRIDKFDEFINTARSKGVSTVIAFQAYADLENTYGAKEADIMVGQFHYKAFLRTESPNTAQWASKIVGRAKRHRKIVVEDGEMRQGEEWRFQGFDHDEVEVRPVLTPEELMGIPKPQPGVTGVKGYFLDDYGYWYKAPSWYLSDQLTKADKTIDNVQKFDDGRVQLLENWTMDDVERLGLPFTEEQMQECAIESRRIDRQVPKTQEGREKFLKAITDHPKQPITDEDIQDPDIMDGETTEDNDFEDPSSQDYWRYRRGKGHPPK